MSKPDTGSDRPLPYGRQWIDDGDVATVVEVMLSDWLTQGPAVERFEKAVADAVGAREAVAVANGTAGLHIAAIAAGLGPGKRLWTSPITFVASANCALYCGAGVDFVDIDPVDANMSPDRLAEKLAAADREGTLPDVVVPVHFGGQPCDMAAIGGLARRYGFKVIEDACHAIGAIDRDGLKTGACDRSDMTVFSFHPVKVVTTGEGGMVTTNDPRLAAHLRRARTHGITRDFGPGDPPDGPWAYRQVEVGYNYRLTDIQAALGCSQLGRLEEFIARRNTLARRYDRELADLPLRPLPVCQGARSAYHLYAVRIDEAAAGLSRREVFERLAERGIRCQVHYIPVHLQPVYRRLGFGPGDFPAAEAYYREAITLPLFPAMSDADQDRVIGALREILPAGGRAAR